MLCGLMVQQQILLFLSSQQQDELAVAEVGVVFKGEVGNETSV